MESMVSRPNLMQGSRACECGQSAGEPSFDNLAGRDDALPSAYCPAHGSDDTSGPPGDAVYGPDRVLGCHGGGRGQMAKHIEIVHHADRRTDVVMPYAPAIAVRG